MKLQKGIHTNSGRPIYFIKDPKTYPIRDKLGVNGLGMKYWQGMWWTYNVTPRLLDSLDKLGVETTEIRQSQSIPAESPSPPVISDIPSDTISPPKKEDNISIPVVNKEWGGPTELYKEQASEKAGFPVRKNIYSTDVTVDINGESVTLNLALNRTYAPGLNSSDYHVVVQRGYRGFPLYNISVGWEGRHLGTIKVPINRKGPDRKWTTIDEEREIAPQVPILVREVAINPATKLHQILEAYLHTSKRDTDFLKFIEEHKEKPFDNRNIEVPHKGKMVSVPIISSFYKYGKELDHKIDIMPALDKTKYPQAPDPSIVGLLSFSDSSVPDEIKTIEEFMAWYERLLTEKLPQIQERYTKYLESFPFAEEEFDNAKVEMSRILNYLVAGSVDINEFKQHLIKMGYLRPRKSRSQAPAAGMVPQEDIKYNILDHKKIINDVYRNKNFNDPESFYTVMAYYLSRLKRNVTSWTEIILKDTIRYWTNTANRFGLQMSIREIDSFFDREARRLYREIFEEQSPKSRSEQYQDFYTGFYGGEGSAGRGEKNRGEKNRVVTSPNQFADFVASLGGDRELALKEPQKAYRQMALKYHPDIQKDKSPANIENATRIFSQLSSMYEQVSGKQAFSNWLQKIASNTCSFKWW